MILLISETPVAGTVARLAKWLGHFFGKPCHPIIMRNYPNNSFRIPMGAFSSLPAWPDVLKDLVERAELIVIHNIYAKSQANNLIYDVVFNCAPPKAKILFQVHSPPLEAPGGLYRPLNDYPFHGSLVIAQGYGRFLPEAVSVPNVVPDATYPFAIQKDRTILLPHMRSTEFRWSGKVTEADHHRLEESAPYSNGYAVTNIHEIFGREAVTHEEVMLRLAATSIVVDDINTGLMHQTTIEVLKTGCYVLSVADMYTIEQMCETLKMDVPPVELVSGINDVIYHLSDPQLDKRVNEMREKATAFSEEFLAEERLARIYYGQLKTAL